MNFKKSIAFLFLMLAGMTMLAFTVVPHHHHEEYICFNLLHCHDGEHPDNHAHDGAEGEHRCVEFLWRMQVERVLSVGNGDDGVVWAQAFFFISDILELPALEARLHHGVALPDAVSFYASRYLETRAGRAPPAGMQA